jgi:hypothetical protein
MPNEQQFGVLHLISARFKLPIDRGRLGEVPTRQFARQPPIC